MKFVALQLPYFDRMGIDFYNTNDLRSKFLKTWPVIMMVFCSYGLINSISEHREDVILITEILSYMLSNIAATVKICTFIFGHQKFVKIYQKMEGLFESATDEVKCEISRYDERNRKMLKCYYIAYLIAAGFLGSLTVVTSSSFWRRRFHDDESSEKILPYVTKYGILYCIQFPNWYIIPFSHSFPFDTHRFPNYEILCVVLLWGGLYHAHIDTAIDGMFFQLTCQLKSHFDGLQDDIKDIKKSLKSFISRHRKILGAVNEINHLYSPVIFIQCVLTSITVCVVSVQIMDSFKIGKIIGNIPFILAVLQQWYIYCHGGEYIATGVRPYKK